MCMGRRYIVWYGSEVDYGVGTDRERGREEGREEKGRSEGGDSLKRTSSEGVIYLVTVDLRIKSVTKMSWLDFVLFLLLFV